MRIKSLQVHGFKSFVDRTVFAFKDGVTAVVGPNGCGKSNVVDAVRWVMGEQSPRRLRGKGMDDVIFAGSETRPPIGMAEVVLTFDNSDGTAPASYAGFSEIQITRRLYRSGESEYLINKSPCRMREVHDFFRDTGIGVRGYTIVEQGRIAEIVSAKPEERRILIEEAAGISKYKARRRDAEGKIKSTEQNLVRVTDVLGEIRRQISSLERQARKAARYKRLRETQRVLELSLAADERAELSEAVESSTSRLAELRDKVTALEAQLSERELAVEERRIALTEAEKGVTRGAERLYGLRSEIKGLEGQIELCRREADGLAESNEGRRAELEHLTEQRQAAETEAETLAAELQQLQDSLDAEQTAIAQAETEAREAAVAVKALETERETANEAFVEVLTGIARGEDRIRVAEDRHAEIDQRLRNADSDIDAHQSEAAQAGRAQSALEEGLRNLLTDRERLQESLVQAISKQEQGVERLREEAERLRDLRERLEARRGRLDSLREVVERREDVGQATRHLMEREAGDRDRMGIRGLVREIIDADPEVERAVEAVLADRAEAVVVATADGAVAALALLREQEAGRGVFVLEARNESVATGTVPLGTPLGGRVRARDGFDGVVRALLGDVYLVDDLAEPLRMYADLRVPATFVTAAGDVLSPEGVIRGGGESVASGMLTRVREVRELADEVASLEAEVAACQTTHEQVEAQLFADGQELDNLRNRQHTAALAVANHEKDLERTRERVKAIGEAHEGRVVERSELLAEGEALAGELEGLRRHLEELRGQRTTRQRDLDALGLRISSATREQNRLENRATELRVAHNGRLESRARVEETVARARATANDTTEWIERREREIEAANGRRDELAQQVREAEEGLAQKLEAEEAARVTGEQEREAFERDAGQLRAIEDEVREVRGGLNGSREEAAAADLRLRESTMRLEHQASAIQERWAIDIAQWQLPRLEDEEGETGAEASAEQGDGAASASDAEAADGSGSDAEAGDEIASVSDAREARRNALLARRPREEREPELERARRQIQSLGEVNVGAIEEHEELAERFRFLSEQKEDLEGTIQSLREAIARINRTSRKRFRETFEAVSKRFSENFPRLFGGGKASLELTEAEDVLEAGIDIMAMPPGKRLQNVNLLSGGEKTMTALALLVAVFQVRPSPFFLLDEVDAALDDANVGRFNALITEMAAVSQFLIITHNKRTIEVADVLYGVTMEQKGVSKLVAVELEPDDHAVAEVAEVA